MRANAEIESQALIPDGKLNPRDAANPTNKNPDGISRNAATKKGPALGKTSFIATIAVPQKKKGDTKRANSKAVPANSSEYDVDSSLNSLGLFDESFVGVAMHSISASESVVLLLGLRLEEKYLILVF
ncbi:hypothetical protein ACJIZ3_002459 [Penstemon smallii]|uniref:Uncharacterized protein n=1 Tax=Penstemon smallii TaxID=265156 RepID=A0ABD3U8C7_9LAMI